MAATGLILTDIRRDSHFGEIETVDEEWDNFEWERYLDPEYMLTD